MDTSGPGLGPTEREPPLFLSSHIFKGLSPDGVTIPEIILCFSISVTERTAEPVILYGASNAHSSCPLVIPDIVLSAD